MKIIVDKDIPFLEGRIGEGCKVEALPGKDITREKVRDADAILVRTRTRCDEALLKDTKVGLVATSTIGKDHIDEVWCEKNGIKVVNAPGCNAPGVAQYVLSSLFALGFDPARNVLGIIGYGNVGQILARWSRDLGIKVLISDEPRREAGFKDVEYLPQGEVLERSDAVSLHVPFTETGKYPTLRLIGNDDMQKMKRGAILVNTSRGGVVHEQSLKKAIREGHLRSIVDVWENEPEIDTELLELAEISTPHIAGYSLEGKMRATRMSLEALKEIEGINVDISGLECEPGATLKLTRKLIENSYNPFVDSNKLKSDPYEFEMLRNKYDYRHEPLFFDWKDSCKS